MTPARQQLYDLELDRREDYNLAYLASDVVERLTGLIERFGAEIEDQRVEAQGARPDWRRKW